MVFSLRGLGSGGDSKGAEGAEVLDRVRGVSGPSARLLTWVCPLPPAGRGGVGCIAIKFGSVRNKSSPSHTRIPDYWDPVVGRGGGLGWGLGGGGDNQGADRTEVQREGLVRGGLVVWVRGLGRGIAFA